MLLAFLFFLSWLEMSHVSCTLLDAAVPAHLSQGLLLSQKVRLLSFVRRKGHSAFLWLALPIGLLSMDAESVTKMRLGTRIPVHDPSCEGVMVIIW